MVAVHIKPCRNFRRGFFLFAGNEGHSPYFFISAFFSNAYNFRLERTKKYGSHIHMRAIEQISGFEWDAGNERKKVDTHGVAMGEAEEVFFNQPVLVLPDTGHSRRENRFHALGKTDGKRMLHITFTLRGEGTLIRVISARDMRKKERRIYEQQG